MRCLYASAGSDAGYGDEGLEGVVVTRRFIKLCIEQRGDYAAGGPSNFYMACSRARRLEITRSSGFRYMNDGIEAIDDQI